MATHCPTHGTNKKCGCQTCFDLVLAENQSFRAENQSFWAQFKSIKELASSRIKVRNETASSSHTGTGHVKASYERMKIPHVDLPDSFWNHRTEFAFPDYIDGEPDVNALLKYLMNTVIKALGLKDYIHSMLDVPIMDTAADVSLTAKNNKMLCGSVEGKKHPRNDNECEKIFGSNTEVAGEAFEQLYLVKIQNMTLAVGLISNLETFQLIATEDISNYVLSATEAKEFFEAKKQQEAPEVTPDKRRMIQVVDAKPSASVAPKKIKVQTTKALPKNNRQPKRGRVGIEIEEANVKREFFATKELSFGGDENQNREVFKLLAGYVLLCAKSLMEEPKEALDLTVQGRCLLTREVRVAAKTFSFKQIKLPYGVQFEEMPRMTEAVFYAIRQLGYGQTGASCFACTSSAAPCVVKFFRKSDGSFDLAKTEAENWGAIYGDLGFDFVRAYDTPRAFLVMPFLRVPCNLAERRFLVEGGESSLLYKALLQFSEKGFIHEEVFWHHVGWIEHRSLGEPRKPQSRGVEFLRRWGTHFGTQLGITSKKRDRNDTVTPNDELLAVFCDLGHAKRCDDCSKREAWVQKSFEDMCARMGDEVNGQPAILPVRNGEAL